MGMIRRSTRRGRVRELAEALDRGSEAVVAFVFRYSDIDPKTECWNWTGPKTAAGYAYMVDPRQPIIRESMPRIQVHRLICAVVYRAMLPEEHARHLCHNPGCVNPEHLAPGSPSENVTDSISAGRWHYPQGVKNGRAKMADEDIMLLRQQFRRNTPGESESWAIKLGVSASTVRQAVSRRTWRHLTCRTMP